MTNPAFSNVMPTYNEEDNITSLHGELPLKIVSHTNYRIIWYFVLLSLLILSIHSMNFSGRNYRQDEAWRVHLALEYSLSETISRSARNLDPPLWQVILEIWVSAFGDREVITRFMSTLLTLVALSITFRLAADLFNYPSALFSAVLLGTLQFFQFYVHETRPYALLVVTTVASQLLFLRWIRRQNFQMAIMFVIFGILTIYTHFYGMFFIASLALYFVSFVRFHLITYVRAAGLFFAIGLSFSGWLLPFLHSFLVTIPGGVDYGLTITDLTSLWNNLKLLDNQMQIRPEPLGWILLIVGLLTPMQHQSSLAIFRYSKQWQKLFVISIPVIILCIALISNQVVSNLTPRNLIIILPSLAILAGYGLYGFKHTRAYCVVLLLLFLFFLSTFRSYIANGPYREVTEFMSPYVENDAFVFIDAPFMWQHVPLVYYIHGRLHIPYRNMFHFMTIDNPAVLQNMPVLPVHLINREDDTLLQEWQATLKNTSQVWYVQVDNGNSFSQSYVNQLYEFFEPTVFEDWGVRDRRYPPYRVTLFQR